MEGRLNLDRFINDRNVERYRKLACAATTSAERKALLSLLAEEKVKCFGPENTRTTEPEAAAFRQAVE
jgi:hypothetical protein